MKHFKNEDFDNLSFVAVDEGKVIGCITVTSALKRGLGSLQRIGVDPGYAGKGVGKMLFDAADKFSVLRYPNGHRESAEMRADIMAFIKKYL